MDKEYICLTCGKTYADGHTYFCSNCGEHICPKCGGECQTIEEYDAAMLINAQEES